MKKAFNGRSFAQELGVGRDLETSQRIGSGYAEQMFELFARSNRDSTSYDDKF